MKSFVQKLLLAIMSGMFTISVFAQESQDEIETWLKDNFEYYSKAPRSEIVKLSLEKQRAVYSRFSPKLKAEIWNYKWNDVKKSIRLSKEEKKELGKLYRVVSPKIYEKNASRQKKRFYKIAEETEKIIREKFGWSEAKLFFYAMLPLTEVEFEEHCKLYGMDFSLYLK